jgi:membrane protein
LPRFFLAKKRRRANCLADRGFVGQEVARAIQGVLQNVYKPRTGIFATVLGLLTLAFGASSFVVELHDVLNVVWKAPVPSSGTGLRSIIALAKERFHALAIVLGAGFLLLVSLVLNPSLTAAAKVLKSSLSIPGSLLQVMNFLLSFLVIAGLFAVIYRVLPEGDFARPNEEHAPPGSAVW